MLASVPANQKSKRRLVISAGVLVILLSVLVPAGYLAALGGRIMYGVELSGVKIGGLQREAARAKIDAAVAIYENRGLNFSYEGKERGLTPVRVPLGDPDAARQLISFDAAGGLEAAYAVGRSGNVLRRLADAAAALAGQRRLTMPLTLDAAGFEEALRQEWKNEESPVADSRLIISMSGNILKGTAATPDKAGFEFDYARAVADLRSRATTLDLTPVELQPARTTPAITQDQATEAAALVPAALGLAPLTLAADERRWTLAVGDLAPMLEAYLRPGGQPSLRIKKNTAAAFFNRLAAEYDVTPADTKFEIDPVTKKMTAFSAGKDGRRIDIEKSTAALGAALELQLAGEDGRSGFSLAAETAKSRVITQSASDLGIIEAIGVGRSDFSGSSTNRIRNIRHGSDKLNGHLVAPGEEFSAIGVLEPVTIEDGYFPEQIILGDRITPEVGGGLCQIGTTLFRAAMNSGLPITERQNHSLVVHYYYDPTNHNPGTDATLYGPHPDLRFVNDTGHWLLITTDVNVKTKTLTYTFWGTPDGRHGSYSPPQVLNWIAAPKEVTEIETADLAPGEQKCQNAFTGANTTFKYTVVKADGAVEQRDFVSHYRALPKICMTGAAPSEPQAPTTYNENPNTNINANANQNANLPPEAAAGN